MLKKNLLSLLFIFQVVMLDEVHAGWIDIPLDNPGAETGDLSGWISNVYSFPVPLNYQATYDPAIAHEGNWFFSPISMDEPYNASMGQFFDLSFYRGSLMNIEFSGYMNVINEQQHRIGYEQDTDTEYEYVLYNYVGVFCYDRDNNWLGGVASSGTIDDGSGWKYGVVNTETHPIFNLTRNAIRDDVDHILVIFQYYYHAVDVDNAPGYWEIDEWGEWIGNEPIVRYDSARLRLEIDDF